MEIRERDDAPTQASSKVPHACPVCGGHKTVQKPPNIAGDQQAWAASDIGFYPCPACDGTGIIWETLV